MSHTKSPSSSLHGKSAQPPTSKSISWAFGSEITTPSKQASKSTTATSSIVKSPVPAGITLFSNEKPRTIDSPTVIVNPASPAAPPEPPSNSTPVTLNWNPAIDSELEYKISKVDAVTFPISIVSGRQVVPSPLHWPQSSTIASPLHSPVQSNTLPSQSHAPSAIPSPQHTPHSSTSGPP